MAQTDNAVKDNNRLSDCSTESSSTEEEERLRRLFQLCDRDQDGFIDSDDLMVMCEQLNMLDSVDDIVHQLGADNNRRVSFTEFARCRRGLVAEIEREQQRATNSEVSHTYRPDTQQTPWMERCNMSHSSTTSLDITAASLFRLMGEHDPAALRQMLHYATQAAKQAGANGDEPNFAELANTLHLTALTSLKGENLELSNRVQRLTSERDHLEKQLNRAQSEKHKQQREFSDQLQETTSRYEDRIIELHSVIAELRTKLDRHNINVIREEDEEDSAVAEISEELTSDVDVSVNENNASRTTSLLDFGAELTADFTRIVDELENAIGDNKLTSPTDDNSTAKRGDQANSDGGGLANRAVISPSSHHDEANNANSVAQMCVEKSNQLCDEVDALQLSPPPLKSPVYTQSADPSPISPTAHPQHQPVENTEEYKDLLHSHEALELDVKRYKGQNHTLREERDRMKRKVRELQTRVQSLEMSTSSPHHSRTSTPTKHPPPTSDSHPRTAPIQHPHRPTQREHTPTQHRTHAHSPRGSGRGSPTKHSRGGGESTSGSEVGGVTACGTVGEVSGNSVAGAPGGTPSLHVAKVAGLKKLAKTTTPFHHHPTPERHVAMRQHVHGAEISSIGLPNAKVAEHLTQSLQEQCDVQEIMNSTEAQEYKPNQTHQQSTNPDAQRQEFEIEFERLTSKIDNFRAQNELLTLTLNESKAHSDRMTVLIGKYESNQTALQIALEYCDQALQCYGVLVQLLDAEREVMIMNCKAAGIGSLGSGGTAGGDSGMEGDEHEHIEQLTLALNATQIKRRQAEHNAKQILQRMAGSSSGGGVAVSTPSPASTASSTPFVAVQSGGGGVAGPSGGTAPTQGMIPGLSGCTATVPTPPKTATSEDSGHHIPSTNSSTGSSVDSEFTALDERRLRDTIAQLYNSRSMVHSTVVQLESIHAETNVRPSGVSNSASAHNTTAAVNPEAQRLDLENAVLMQELMAIKEEKAELRSHNYMLEKERSSLELQLYGKQSQEQAYIVQIEHLKAEVHDQHKQQPHTDDSSFSSTPSITLAELRSNNPTEIAHDLGEALKRERKLKTRVQELVMALEKLSQNAEISHQQSAQFVNDLKNANSALVLAFEKAKKKYQSRMKKLEQQLSAVTERYETEIHQLRHHIMQLENKRPTNETSL